MHFADIAQQISLSFRTTLQSTQKRSHSGVAFAMPPLRLGIYLTTICLLIRTRKFINANLVSFDLSINGLYISTQLSIQMRNLMSVKYVIIKLNTGGILKDTGKSIQERRDLSVMCVNIKHIAGQI